MPSYVCFYFLTYLPTTMAAVIDSLPVEHPLKRQPPSNWHQCWFYFFNTYINLKLLCSIVQDKVKKCKANQESFINRPDFASSLHRFSVFQPFRLQFPELLLLLPSLGLLKESCMHLSMASCASPLRQAPVPPVRNCNRCYNSHRH